MAAAFASVFIVVPFVWFIMDRDPPYVRSNGEITAAEPGNCGLFDGVSRHVNAPIRAGSCVEVKWSIKTYRNCPAASNSDNVVRHLKDSLAITKPIGTIRRDAPETESKSSIVKQYLVLPMPLPVGTATYTSSACFACNPLQRLFWPICIDEPEINFEVVE